MFSPRRSQRTDVGFGSVLDMLKTPKGKKTERSRLNSRSIYFENTAPLIKLQCTTSKTRGDQRINKNNNICPWKSNNNNNSSSSFASSHLLTPRSWAHRCSENLCFIARHPQTHTHTHTHIIIIIIIPTTIITTILLFWFQCFQSILFVFPLHQIATESN